MLKNSSILITGGTGSFGQAFVPLTSNFIRRRNSQLKTWQDWVIHTQSHCEACRITSPPSQCVADLEKRKKAL